MGAAAEPARWIPLVNVALGPWLARAAEHHPAELAACRRVCRALGVPRLSSAWLGDAFAFEASVLLPDRWAALEQAWGVEPSVDLASRWADVKQAVLTLRRVAEPPGDPVRVAGIVADTSSMRALIDGLLEPAEVERATRGLVAFTRSVPALVRRHHGALVHAGAQVRAFVPASALDGCVDALRHSYASHVLAVAREAPSLSLGLATADSSVTMAELLALAHQARTSPREAPRRSEPSASVGGAELELERFGPAPTHASAGATVHDGSSTRPRPTVFSIEDSNEMGLSRQSSIGLLGK